MTRYITLRSDGDYSSHADRTSLANFLSRVPGLHQVGPQEFRSASDQPWVSVVLAASDKNGNYRVGDEPPVNINVVELICSSGGDASWYHALAGQIAEFLGWVAYEDHENRRVWPEDGSVGI